MSIIKEYFGKIGEKDVYNYKMDNEMGLTAEIISYGGIIKNLTYKGVDVVLGRDNLDEYTRNDGCFGALIGRNSNRIEAAEFELNGKKYTLAKNNGRNNLHGGLEGFNKKVWDSKPVDKKEPSLILTLVSHDGDEGFPGKVKVSVTYTLTKNNSIKIHYEGKSDKDTVLNMTNHSYFNLNGHNSGTAENHTIIMDADFFTPNTEECMPYGEILKVD
ncbi:MAG: aldose epimerase family protein, partial [Bacillota bacterium]|nr:aldose epimerase family protein [Bacillota bacterium]